MDDAERIPIDLGYEVGSPAQPSDQRTTVREDGTIVIDLLAPQACETEPTTDDEIVVCAQESGAMPAGKLVLPPQPSAAEKIGEALHVKVGPLELGSIPRGDGTRSFGALIRF